MGFLDYLQMLRTSWRTLLVGALLGGAAAGGLNALSVPQYQVSMQLFVSTSGALEDTVQGSEYAQSRISSYARLLSSKDLATTVVDDLNLGLSADELRGEIAAAVVENTVMIDVTVTDSSPERALAIAEALHPAFADQVADIETNDANTEAGSPVDVEVVSSPELPTASTSPGLLRSLALGVVLGLLAGAGAAVLRARLDTRIRDEDAAADAGLAPALGSIVEDAQLADTHLAGLQSGSRTGEAFRQIRTSLQFLGVDKPPRVIMVSSALPAEGKSTVAVNLALSIAQTGRRVTLVEADLRRPRAAQYLGKLAGAGLTSVLSGAADLDEVLQEHGDGRLTFLAAGPTPPNPSELLGSEAMGQLLARLAERSDIVLIDGPPLLPIADGRGLAPLTDGVVLCARHGSTTFQQLELAREGLDGVGANTLGVVLNFVPANAVPDSANLYGYGLPDAAVPKRRWFGGRIRPAQEQTLGWRLDAVPAAPRPAGGHENGHAGASLDDQPRTSIRTADTGPVAGPGGGNRSGRDSRPIPDHDRPRSLRPQRSGPRQP